MTQLFCIRHEEMVDSEGACDIGHQQFFVDIETGQEDYYFCDFPDGSATCPPPEFNMGEWLETAEPPPADELDYTE